MALPQSDLMRLLQPLRTADGAETIRVPSERILQEPTGSFFPSLLERRRRIDRDTP
jgi:hypothetical protein